MEFAPSFLLSIATGNPRRGFPGKLCEMPAGRQLDPATATSRTGTPAATPSDFVPFAGFQYGFRTNPNDVEDGEPAVTCENTADQVTIGQ
jgi:hypothetical protein